MVEPLTDRQQRVIGALAEKAATVPDTYPMTLKGLQTACNQKNSRDPVTDLTEHDIQVTLDELKACGLVRFVYASHGARSTKYRHVLDEQLGLAPGELALLTVLLLRGPQTVNELRSRTERAHPFEDNELVEATLEDLADRDDPLVVHLARQIGQKETRWTHLLGGPVDATAGRSGPDPIEVERPMWGDTRRGDAGPGDGAARADDVTMDATSAGPTAGPPAAPTAGLAERVAALEERVAELEAMLTGPDEAASDHQHPTGSHLGIRPTPEEHPPT